MKFTRAFAATTALAALAPIGTALAAPVGDAGADPAAATSTTLAPAPTPAPATTTAPAAATTAAPATTTAAAVTTAPVPTVPGTATSGLVPVDLGVPEPPQPMLAAYGIPQLLDVRGILEGWGFGQLPAFPIINNALLVDLEHSYTTGALEELYGSYNLAATFAVSATSADLQRISDAVVAALALDPLQYDRTDSAGTDDGVQYIDADFDKSDYNAELPDWRVLVTNDTVDSPDVVAVRIEVTDSLDTSRPLPAQLTTDFSDEIATAVAAGLGDPVGFRVSIGVTWGFFGDSKYISFLFNGPAEAAAQAACAAFGLVGAQSEYSEEQYGCTRDEGGVTFNVVARANYTDEAFTNVDLQFID